MSPRSLSDPERTIQCPVCQRRFKNIWSLRIHFKKAHHNQGQCPRCGKVFKDLPKHYRNAAFRTGDILYKTLYVLTVKKTRGIPSEWLDQVEEYLTVKE